MNRLLAGLAAALLLSAALAAPGPYDVFPETRSPGGRWAVAWGVPGKTLDSAKIRAADAENPELDAAASDPAKVENYLVDLKARKIAGEALGFPQLLPGKPRRHLGALVPRRKAGRGDPSRPVGAARDVPRRFALRGADGDSEPGPGRRPPISRAARRRGLPGGRKGRARYQRRDALAGPSCA